MSTKIYNGYLVEGKKNLYQLNQWNKSIREALQAAQLELVENEMANRYAKMRDDLALGDKAALETWLQYIGLDMTLDNFSIANVLMITYHLYKKAKQSEERSLFDFDCSAVFIPIIGKDKKHKTLALFFGINSFKEIFAAQPDIKEYCYYNNVDRPKEILETDWEIREYDWAKALPGAGVPSENGFVVEYCNDFPFDVNRKRIFKKIKSKEERAKEVSAERFFDLKIKDFSLEKEGYSKIRKTIDAYLQTEDGKKEYTYFYESILEQLPDIKIEEL